MISHLYDIDTLVEYNLVLSLSINFGGKDISLLLPLSTPLSTTIPHSHPLEGLQICCIIFSSLLFKVHV